MAYRNAPCNATWLEWLKAMCPGEIRFIETTAEDIVQQIDIIRGSFLSRKSSDISHSEFDTSIFTAVKYDAIGETKVLLRIERKQDVCHI